MTAEHLISQMFLATFQQQLTLEAATILVSGERSIVSRYAR